MKMLLETHKYAPEMNRLYFLRRGRIVASMRAPGCHTIQQFRARYFRRAPAGLFALIDSVYVEPEFAWLNRHVAHGRCDSRVAALRFSRRFQQDGGLLVDGSTLPRNRIAVRFVYN